MGCTYDVCTHTCEYDVYTHTCNSFVFVHMSYVHPTDIDRGEEDFSISMGHTYINIYIYIYSLLVYLHIYLLTFSNVHEQYVHIH